MLKPSRPITATDQQIHFKAFGLSSMPNGEVWSTYTRVGPLTFGIVLAIDMHNTFALTPLNINLDLSSVRNLFGFIHILSYLTYYTYFN